MTFRLGRFFLKCAHPPIFSWVRHWLGGPVVQALVDAAGLVDSYHRSTLWRRVRSGRSMAIRLRDMRDVIDSYCVLLLFINAHLLLQHATHHPPSDTTTSMYGYVHELEKQTNLITTF